MLRKTSSQISLTYQGGVIDGLFATHFTIAENPTLAIGLDLTCNLKVRNKSTNDTLTRSPTSRDGATNSRRSRPGTSKCARD